VDARARDAHALIGVLAGRSLPTALAQAARLLAAVVGQDLEPGTDGTFRIAQRVAADFNLLAAAVNLARLGVLGLHWAGPGGWAAA
jgi:hypothetical protein